MSAELITVATDAPAGAAFTTRRGGVSEGAFASLNLSDRVGDDPAAVDANWRRVGASIGVGPVTLLRQVHGAAVHEVAVPGAPLEGDGLVTEAPGAPIAVLGADCLPILLWRRDRPRVAAAHAGWRGLVAGVVEAAVAALREPERAGAAIGPGIGPCCYPVSPEVRGAFAGRFGRGAVAGEAVDLAAAARAALLAAGVPEPSIRTVEACTSCDARFFSHRRDAGRTGRQAGIVWVAA